MSGIGKLKGACGRCRKQDTCHTLCTRVERYADQDHVELLEICLSDLIEKPVTEDVFFSLLAIQNGLLQDCRASILTEWHDIECLSALDNEIIRLKHVKLLTFKKIAQRVHQKTATCRRRYSRAMKDLREFMQNGGKAFSDVG